MVPTDKEEFVAHFGGVYEHSSWIAADSWPACQMAHDAEQMAAIMAGTVESASRHDKLALIRAHPDLAGRLAVAGELTADSAAEQASAGLDQCTEEEFERFQTLNQTYVAKFEFPFVMAVRGSSRSEILEAFAKRVENSYEEEFATALQEIHKIARLRLEQLFT